MALHLDITLVTQNADRLVGGRTSQFIPNWHKLTQDQWVLITVQGYHLRLAQWPDQQLYTKEAGDNQQLVSEVEVQKLVEKGTAQQVQLSQVHLVSPVFVVPKSGGGWRPIIDLRLLNSFLEPPHFKMEGLYMLMEVLKQGWQMER